MSVLEKRYELGRRVLILLGVLAILGASAGSTHSGELADSGRLHVRGLKQALFAIDAEDLQQATPIDIAPGLTKLAEAMKVGQNPTIETPTEIEGNWVGTCHSLNTSFNGKTARSFNVGYIFRGNSFYRQVDYYPEADCRYSGAGTLAENRVAGELAAGWFVLGHSPNGLKTIDWLAAPNFNSVYMLNVYQMKAGATAVLLMGDAELNNKERPTAATQEYRHWEPGKNYK